MLKTANSLHILSISLFPNVLFLCMSCYMLLTLIAIVCLLSGWSHTGEKSKEKLQI